MFSHLHHSVQDTIVALSTPPGTGALAVIRVSGPDTFGMMAPVFKGRPLHEAAGATVVYGHIVEGTEVLDEVVVAVYKGPRSYTKQDSVEISCHGSPLIAQNIINLLLKQGMRLAQPGEFTMRAFQAGRFDLAQAEAVADLIHAESEAARKMALQQMRGGFSRKLSSLRQELIHFASLIELELDFGEEDVEFADRDDLKQLIQNILRQVNALKESFKLGNVLKHGVATVIAGKPNAGKSTLLNQLLQEEKALVSNIPGTTRDFIEDVVAVQGIRFRFIDTAGLRETTDVVEAMGVARTRQKMQEASLIIYLFDLSASTVEDLTYELDQLSELEAWIVPVANKLDLALPSTKEAFLAAYPDLHLISAAQDHGIDALKEHLVQKVQEQLPAQTDIVVSNVRHHDALVQTGAALEKALYGLKNGLTGDFLALDIRHALYHLGEITGEITTEHLLDNIFSKFCIGK